MLSAMVLPPGFIKEMRSLLGNEADKFFLAMEENPVVSIRLNRRKPGIPFPQAEKVKWCESGFYLKNRPLFTLDPLLHAGAYYVQDASSMIHETVVERLLSRFSPSEDGEIPTPLLVLDLCAAPGGKTTAMINALPDGSLILANEVMPKRRVILEENLIKWGYPEYKVLGKESNYFSKKFPATFDIVSVDAPCSGEGMMRKEPKAVEQWNENLIKSCALLQKEILKDAVKTLKPGGYLVYSTCTFNREENEKNVEFIKEIYSLEVIDLDFPAEWGIAKGIGSEWPVYRFMPHVTKGEGLFLAVFRKPGIWTPTNAYDVSRVKDAVEDNGNKGVIDKKGKSKISGKKGERIPVNKKEEETIEITNILSTSYIRNTLPEVELNLEDALSFLRRESLKLPSATPLGHVVVTYKGFPLGLMKNIGTRANNLYPKNWRILMQ